MNSSITSNNTMSTPISLPARILPRLYDIEKCNECGASFIEGCCEKCGEGVCLNKECCHIFPHYNNSKYIVCRECVDNIEQKLHQLVEDNHDTLHPFKQGQTMSTNRLTTDTTSLSKNLTPNINIDEKTTTSMLWKKKNQ